MTFDKDKDSIDCNHDSNDSNNSSHSDDDNSDSDKHRSTNYCNDTVTTLSKTMLVILTDIMLKVTVSKTTATILAITNSDSDKD